MLLGLPYFGVERNEHDYERTESIEDLAFLAGSIGIVASSMDTHLYALAAEPGLEHFAEYNSAAREARWLGEELARASAASGFEFEADTARVVDLVLELVNQGDLFRDALSRPGVTGRVDEEDGWLEAQEATAVALARFQPLVTGAREDGHRRMAAGFNRTEWLILVLAAATAAVVGTYASLQVRQMLRREAAASERLGRAERRADYNSAVVNLASHELRSPLAVMQLSGGMIESAAAERGDSSLGELAAMATGAARRAELLVNELLDMGRLDAGRLELARQPVDVGPALERVIAITEERRGQRPVEMTGLPASVLADPERLAIVLRNLVDNAFKYSPAGSPVRIDVRSEGEAVVVRVSDEGPGIPPADRERVFARFERLDQTAGVGGIGIGLHLSRELTMRMDGSLNVVPGHAGACFELKLPATGLS